MIQARRSGLALLSLIVVGCGFDVDRDDWLMPNLTTVRPDPATADSTWHAVPLRMYGELDGEMAFGAPGSVATLPDGALAVGDYLSCTITIIDRPAGEVRAHWGRCGDGPGEFRLIRAMAAHGDSLFVYDQGRQAIVVLSVEGVEGRRMPIIPSTDALSSPGPFTLSHLDVLDDTTLVVATEAAGNATVSLMDRRTGVIHQLVAAQPPIADDSSIRHMASCVRPPGEWPPTIVAMSEWAMEAVGFDPRSGDERFHFFTDLDLPPRLDDGGRWRTGPRDVDLRCGESAFLARVTTLAPEDHDGGLRITGNVALITVRLAAVILELRSYDGELLMRWWIDDRDSVLRGAPQAFRGDTLFVTSSTVRPYPIIGEAVLLESPRLKEGVRRKE